MSRAVSVQKVVAGALLVGAFLLGLGPFGEASRADVRDTKHNLVKRPGQDTRDTDSKDVCVFCHFPSVGAPEDGEASNGKPKWQRSISLTHAFPIYDDIGRADLKDGGTVGSQSVACLACHDSNQAFAVTALSFDHPFGVPYRGALASARPAGAVLEKVTASPRPLRFGEGAVEPEFRPAFEGTVDGRKIFWASTQTNSYRRGKTDLPLYGRHDEEGGEIVPYVECTSCHDPHSSNPLFLRISNSGNQLCLTCHDK